MPLLTKPGDAAELDAGGRKSCYPLVDGGKPPPLPRPPPRWVVFWGGPPPPPPGWGKGSKPLLPQPPHEVGAGAAPPPKGGVGGGPRPHTLPLPPCRGGGATARAGPLPPAMKGMGAPRPPLPPRRAPRCHVRPPPPPSPDCPWLGSALSPLPHGSARPRPRPRPLTAPRRPLASLCVTHRHNRCRPPRNRKRAPPLRGSLHRQWEPRLRWGGGASRGPPETRRALSGGRGGQSETGGRGVRLEVKFGASRGGRGRGGRGRGRLVPVSL